MPAAPDTLETARLRATRLTDADTEAVHAMHQDARIMASIGGVRDADRTAMYMADNLDHWQRRGFGIYLLHDRGTGALVGRAGLRTIAISADEAGVEIAYVMLPAMWGRGLATEITQQLIALARDTLRLSELVAVIHPDNTPSLRIAERAGFRHDGWVERHTGRFMLHRLPLQP